MNKTNKMINPIILFTLALILTGLVTSEAKIIKTDRESVIEVTGQLQVLQTKETFSASIETTDGRELGLLNLHMPWQACQLGEFVIERLNAGEMGKEAGYFLVEVIECYDDIYRPQMNKGQWICPEIYEPVCAQPSMKSCAPGMSCVQVMPAARSYVNLCQMWIDGADFVEFGTCEENNNNRY